MSTHVRLRAVPAPALRNSPAWLGRLFASDGESLRHLVGRCPEGILDACCLDQERIYTSAPLEAPGGRLQAQVVLGGRPVFRNRSEPPLLVLTAAQTRRVAGFLEHADFDALWDLARDRLLPGDGGMTEAETSHAFIVTHRALRAFYTHAAQWGAAVVKCCSEV
ncbi:DUF1877 domain-containing protein [Streptomyces sp. NPDC048279]|uniref:DUF1877 domain-containing protein n=1 Tax=Streptomyces sp. NPDC048279 TaxID=3154714 RepID=UPI0034131241